MVPKWKQCHPSAKIVTEPKNGLEGGSLEDTINVNLIVEVVVLIDRRGRSRNRVGFGGGSPGSDTRLPMTQTPFPFDDNKTNVLCLWEHSKFKGVVDHFTLE